MEAQQRVAERSSKNLPLAIGRRTKHGRASSRRGRFILLAIFCVLRGTDLLMYFSTPAFEMAQVISAMIVSGIWTTALLIAIGFRKSWARHILCGVLILGMIACIMFASSLVQEGIRDRYLAGILMIEALIYGGILGTLLYSPSIRRLAEWG